MIMHQNPNNVVSDIYQSYQEYLNITNKNSFFCFGLRNTNSLTNFLDETIYTAELLVNVQDKNGTKKSTSISIKACEEQDIPETQSVQDYFEENPVNNLYCIADYGPIELEGSEDNSYMKFFNINIKICQNTTENNFSCKGPDIIKSTIANSSFYLGFMAYAVDPMNYSFPFLQMGSFFSTPIDFNFQSLTTLTFQHIEIITDDGLILENSDILKGLNKLSDRTAYIMRKDANDETILQQTTIELDKVVESYSRKYDKLQDVLAKTGGVMKIIMIVAYIISRPLVRFGFYEDICNDIFDYRMKGSKEKTVLKLSFWQKLKSFFAKNDRILKEKKQLLGITKRKIQETLNIGNILKKLLELEKLKYILLSEEQLNVFQYIPKPLAYLPNFRQRISVGTQLKNNTKISVWEDIFMNTSILHSNDNEPNKAWETYQMLSDKERKTDIDKKLLKCFGFRGNVQKRLAILAKNISVMQKYTIFRRLWRKIRGIVQKVFLFFKYKIKEFVQII